MEEKSSERESIKKKDQQNGRLPMGRKRLKSFSAKEKGVSWLTLSLSTSEKEEVGHVEARDSRSSSETANSMNYNGDATYTPIGFGQFHHSYSRRSRQTSKSDRSKTQEAQESRRSKGSEDSCIYNDHAFFEDLGMVSPHSMTMMTNVDLSFGGESPFHMRWLSGELSSDLSNTPQSCSSKIGTRNTNHSNITNDNCVSDSNQRDVHNKKYHARQGNQKLRAVFSLKKTTKLGHQPQLDISPDSNYITSTNITTSVSNICCSMANGSIGQQPDDREQPTFDISLPLSISTQEHSLEDEDKGCVCERVLSHSPKFDCMKSLHSLQGPPSHDKIHIFTNEDNDPTKEKPTETKYDHGLDTVLTTTISKQPLRVSDYFQSLVTLHSSQPHACDQQTPVIQRSKPIHIPSSNPKKYDICFNSSVPSRIFLDKGLQNQPAYIEHDELFQMEI